MITHAFAVVFGDTGGWGLFVRIVTIFFVALAIMRLVPVRRHKDGSRRPYGMPLRTAGGMAVVAVLAGYGYAFTRTHPHTAPPVASVPARAVTTTHYLGVYEPGEIGNYQNVVKFGNAVGRQPNLVLYYSTLGTPFQTAFVDTAYQHGAVTFVDLNPGKASMAAVASGRYDSELRAFARQIRAYGHPVILSFAPEANGNWYRWGYGHTSPRTWVAAWRHVVTVFRQQHAVNVTWMWVMNVPFPHSGPVSAYWPGAAYVGIAGIDGYYTHRSDTFSSVFAPIIGQVRKLTNKPVMISETAVGPESGASKIPGLFAGVKADHLLGLVWFDQPQHGGPYRQDWRLGDAPAALAAFRAAVKKYR
jgi:hypothetical protein